MQSQFIEFIFLIIIILALVMVANRLRIAYPIVLVIGGLGLSIFSAFSNITIDPELVFFIFLPPLLYEAAWQTSWKEFWKWRRVITSFAFPIVIITSCVVAFVSNALIPGFTLALGFLLGGIVSPPDAVSATTIMRNVKVPKSMVSIIEGESLLNDASSLVVFRFALAAVITGQFNAGAATLNFFIVIIMGALIGVAVGFIFFAIHRWLPTTSSIDVILTLVTPYCMYYAAEQFHFSGVLAVVSGGLLLSSKRQSMLTFRARMEGVNVWSSFVFVLNGLIFCLIGLQLPLIVKGLGDISFTTALWYALVITGTLIIARFICTFGAMYFTRFISRFITVADPNPNWKGPLILGWTGMRGVVSLAAALSIPLLIDGEAFPYRNLILFITFVVILITLVVQGSTLPWLIRKVKLEESVNSIPEEKQEIIIQKKLAKISFEHIEEKYENERQKNAHLNNFYNRLKTDLKFFEQELDDKIDTDEHPIRSYQDIYLELLDYQRKMLTEMNRKHEFDEDLIRKYLSLIDIEEYRLRERQV